MYRLFITGVSVVLLAGMYTLSGAYTALDHWWNYQKVTAVVEHHEKSCKLEGHKRFGSVKVKQEAEWGRCVPADELSDKDLRYSGRIYQIEKHRVVVRYQSPADKIHIRVT